MDNPGEPFTYWQSIAHAADNGSLYLDAEAAKACSSVCDEYIKKLIAHKASAADLTNAHGWGAFASGEQLRDVIAKKAMGGTAPSSVDSLG